MKIGKFRISKTWLVVLVIVLLAAGYSFLKSALKSPTEGYVTEKISAGEVLQEVSETGSVKATEEINLGFKISGKISSINVFVGDVVKKGQVLAELDKGQIFAQLQNAQAALQVAESQYKKLVSGSTPEDVKVYEDSVTAAEHDLQSAYDSALNILRDAYIKAYNAHAEIVTIKNDYFNTKDQPGTRVSESEDDIEFNMNNIKGYLAKAESNAKEDVENGLSSTFLALDNIFNDLRIIREQCDEQSYYSKVSSTDKSSIDTQKSNINTASTSVTTAINDIKSYKAALQKAQDNLSFKVAHPRSEDVSIYQAQIEQAQANVNLYQNQMTDNYLRSPIDGKITEINVKRGETVSASSSVINLLSTEPFQIKVDIYEQDIVNVKLGDAVKINLVAFPKDTLEGKVLSIDPAEKIVDNVVYYEVTVEFPKQPDGIRSGMTADIVIETNKKENALRIPKNAVQSIDNKYTVKVIQNGKIEDREVFIGLEGNDYFEIVSGLSAGEEVITAKK